MCMTVYGRSIVTVLLQPEILVGIKIVIQRLGPKSPIQTYETKETYPILIYVLLCSHIVMLCRARNFIGCKLCNQCLTRMIKIYV
jgi:hypothetical protein